MQIDRQTDSGLLLLMATHVWSQNPDIDANQLVTKPALERLPRMARNTGETQPPLTTITHDKKGTVDNNIKSIDFERKSHIDCQWVLFSRV